MKTVLQAISCVSLAVLILAPVLYYLGKVELDTNKHIMLGCTVAWFVTAPFWMKTKSRS